MPYAKFQQGNKYCVFKLDADGNKVGETLGCHPSEAAAARQVDALYANEKKEKAGARHNKSDNQLISDTKSAAQSIVQNMIDLGAADAEKSTVAIFKDATGHYRWVTLSSSAFQDRDKEIVSTKALADDVARADKDGDYGPLRWWHVDGADLGVCDFNAMEGRVLVESGTFLDEAYGERLKDYADELEVSIGFRHPPDEPGKDGVYEHIRRFERSLVPEGKASNLLTQFAIKEGDDMEKEKESKLRQFLGPLADKVLGKAKEVQADAEQKGVAFKAEDAPVADPPDTEVKADETPKTIGGMTQEQLQSYVAKCLEPMAKELGELKAALSAKKESEESTQAASLKAAQELGDGMKALQETLTTQGDALKIALEGVAELKGELPRAQTKNYFRASEDGAAPGDKFKNVGPQKDPLAPFMNALLNQPQGQ